jgi:hypothetical protein
LRLTRAERPSTAGSAYTRFRNALDGGNTIEVQSAAGDAPIRRLAEALELTHSLAEERSEQSHLDHGDD